MIGYIFVLAYGVLTILGLIILATVANSIMALAFAVLCSALVYAFQVADQMIRPAVMPKWMLGLWALIIITGAISGVLSLTG